MEQGQIKLDKELGGVVVQAYWLVSLKQLDEDMNQQNWLSHSVVLYMLRTPIPSVVRD